MQLSQLMVRCLIFSLYSAPLLSVTADRGSAVEQEQAMVDLLMSATANAAELATSQPGALERPYIPDPGGAITTPAFQYPIKPSDLKTPQASGAYEFTINAPGRYYIAADVAARPNTNSSYTNATLIYITASDVTLDLNGKTIRAATGSNANQAGLTAIQVAANLSNIVIRNGQINGRALGGTTSYITNGIAVNSGCNSITLSDLQLTNIGGNGTTAVNPFGTVTPYAFGIAINCNQDTTSSNRLRDITLQNCLVNNTATGAAGTSAAGIYISYTDSVTLNNCTVDTVKASGSSNPSSYGVYTNNVNTIKLQNCTANGVGGNSNSYGSGAATGFYLASSTVAVECNNCLAARTYSNTTTYSAIGFDLSGTGPYRLNDCTVTNNTTDTDVTSASNIGFYNNSTAITNFKNCTVAASAANGALAGTGGVTGFFTQANSKSTLTNCVATGLSCAGTTGGYNYGFYITGISQLDNCSATANSSNLSNSSAGIYGFFGPNTVTARDCTATKLTCSGGNNASWAVGFQLNGNGSRFYRCAAKQISQTGAVAKDGGVVGFEINTDLGSMYLQDCVASANSAKGNGGCYGFDVNIGAVPVQLVDCTASNNTTDELSSSTGSVYGFYFTDTAGARLERCIADTNYIGLVDGGGNPTGSAYGFFLTGVTNSQLINCQARNNKIFNGSGSATASAYGIYSTSGTANEYLNCTAMGNGNRVANASAYAFGINLIGENRSKIVGCDCSNNAHTGAQPTSTARSAGIYLGDPASPGASSCAYTIIRDCNLNFNFNNTVNTSGLYYGFYDDAADTTSVLINNVATGQGRCIALLTSSFQFPANTSMNYYFKFTGDQENPANMIHETDNFNWTTVSTAVQNWSNISIAVGEVS